eukprot:1872384-Amphidinium_carterae.2
MSAGIGLRVQRTHNTHNGRVYRRDTQWNAKTIIVPYTRVRKYATSGKAKRTSEDCHRVFTASWVLVRDGMYSLLLISGFSDSNNKKNCLTFHSIRPQQNT